MTAGSCPHCGKSLQRKPSHVTITAASGKPETYRLGKVIGSGHCGWYQIQCLRDGLVHRVVSWRDSWRDGTHVHTGGEDLHFHVNQEA